MSDKISAIVEECRVRLCKHRELLHHALEKGGQQDDPPAVMLMRTVDFGLQTMKALACKWSINLFKRCFPQQYGRLVHLGHMLFRPADVAIRLRNRRAS